MTAIDPTWAPRIHTWRVARLHSRLELIGLIIQARAVLGELEDNQPVTLEQYGRLQASLQLIEPVTPVALDEAGYALECHTAASLVARAATAFGIDADASDRQRRAARLQLARFLERLHDAVRDALEPDSDSPAFAEAQQIFNRIDDDQASLAGGGA